MGFLGLSLTKNLVAVKNSRDHFKRSFEQMSTDYKKLTGSYENEVKNRKELEAKFEALKSESAKKDAELLEGGKTISSLNNKIFKMEGKEIAFDALKEELRVAKTTLKDNDDTITSLTKKIESLEKTNASYFSQLGNKGRTIKSLNAKLDVFMGRATDIELEKVANIDNEEAAGEEIPNGENKCGPGFSPENDQHEVASPYPSEKTVEEQPNEDKTTQESKEDIELGEMRTIEIEANVVTDSSKQFNNPDPDGIVLVLDKKFAVDSEIFFIFEDSVAVFTVKRSYKSSKGKIVHKVVYEDHVSTLELSPEMFTKGQKFYQ